MGKVYCVSYSLGFYFRKRFVAADERVKWFKVDRLQIIVVAKNITVLQLFIGRMPNMCAIPQLVSASLNPIQL